jgi:hypothetical protein
MTIEGAGCESALFVSEYNWGKVMEDLDMSARIKTGYAENEPLASNFADDVAWINKNRQALYEQYGSCVLLVYHEQVIGHGASVEDATADAETRLADDVSVVTPVVKHLSSPYRIGVLRRKQENS